MRFSKTTVAGVWLIDIEPIVDERGFFARAWCRHEFEQHGCGEPFVQASVAVSRRQGTLRGLHYQLPPHQEAKLVRATRGAAYVVALDLRHDSPGYGRWCAAELTAENRRMIYVPPGCAQGYQTLADDSELLYQMSAFYAPDAARGVRYDDPAFAIRWPLDVAVISAKDRSWPDYVS
ncbi:MAG TPA: dTDP-4-dehydrorhamnose 3,5-epimerase [Pirellulales bacterium]|nr:dTDP-4-dehydrorhamnose 3,5-epimerase [Pirellulales bacterium]